MALPDTVQGIGGLLRRKGFTPSTTTTTRIRGYHNHSHGFKVQKTTLDFVGVRYVARLTVYGSDRADRRHEAAEQTNEIEKVLKAEGYYVVRGDFVTPDDERTDYLWISVEGFK